MAPRTDPRTRQQPHQRRECHNRGFTLLEMMLVIVLVGITSSLVVTRMSPERDPLARAGSILLGTLENALEQATQRERLYGLALAQDGWQLRVYSREQVGKNRLSGEHLWLPAAISPFNLPENVQISLQIEQQDVALPERLTPEIEPQLWLYAGGETSVFDLRLVQDTCLQHISASGFMSFQRTEIRCDDD